MKSGRKKPRQTREETRLAGLLVSEAPNVVTLVRVCGNPFGVWRQASGKIRILPLGQR